VAPDTISPVASDLTLTVISCPQWIYNDGLARKEYISSSPFPSSLLDEKKPLSLSSSMIKAKSSSILLIGSSKLKGILTVLSNIILA